jgi:hypothetical protein
MPIGDVTGIVEWASDTIPIKSIVNKTLTDIQKSHQFAEYRHYTEKRIDNDFSKFKKIRYDKRV